MSKRAGNILFCVFLGGLGGFYAAVAYDCFFFGLSSEWPTGNMIMLPLVCSFSALILARDRFPRTDEPLTHDDLDSFGVPVFYMNDVSHDIAIEKVYTPSIHADLIRERMHLTRTGRLKMRGKNHRDTFKELMEGSDPLDT